jgi:hypothetical protein
MIDTVSNLTSVTAKSHLYIFTELYARKYNYQSGVPCHNNYLVIMIYIKQWEAQLKGPLVCL